MMAGVIYFGLDANPPDGRSAYGDGYVNTALYWAFADFLNLVLAPVCPEECEVILEARYMGIVSFIDLEAPSYNRVVRGIRAFFDGCAQYGDEFDDAKWVWLNVGEPMEVRDARYDPLVHKPELRR